MLGAPFQCSLFLVKGKNLLHEANCAGAKYLFQQDKHYDVSWDTGDKSLQCGRKVNRTRSVRGTRSLDLDPDADRFTDADRRSQAVVDVEGPRHQRSPRIRGPRHVRDRVLLRSDREPRRISTSAPQLRGLQRMLLVSSPRRVAIFNRIYPLPVFQVRA